MVLVAPVSAGKTTVVKFLNKYRFRQYRFSDAIKNELVKMGVKEDDPIKYRELGDKMRDEQGPSVLSKMGINALKGYKGLLVFDGARHPAEIDALREEYGDELFVLAVDAPFVDRYKRYAEKFKDKGGLTEEKFNQLDQSELDSGNENGHHVAMCMRMADDTIINDADLTEFEEEVDAIVEKNFDLQQ